MNKAIRLLTALLEPDAEDRIDFDDNAMLCGHNGSKEWVYAHEALEELQAYKAKMEEPQFRKCPPDCKQADHCDICSRAHADQYAIQLRELTELKDNKAKEINECIQQ